MAEIIKGADVRAALVEKMKAKIAETGVKPILALVRVGEDGSDLAYQRGIIKTCGSVGIEPRVFAFPADISQDAFEAEFGKINNDPEIHGILLFRPLPKHLSDRAAAQIIDPEKDVDCMSPVNWGKLAAGDESGYFPATAEAVMKICEYTGIDPKGKNVVIMGTSLVAGRPLGYLMTAKRASVSWCNTATKNPLKRCEDADIFISACGRAGLITKEYVEKAAPGCVAIDVGVNFKDGKMCGDFVFDEVEPYVAKITPVPGGVGAVTNSVTACHVVRAAVKAKTGEVFNF